MPTHWTKDYHEVIYFMSILWHADELQTSVSDISSVYDYLQAPHKWNDEHEVWDQMERPEPDSTDWDQFVTALHSPQIEDETEDETEVEDAED